MSLEQTLIATAERECGARLAAIEQAAGLIAEAETLAATLRHHGIADAKAVGFSSAWITPPSASVRCWVNTISADAQSLLQALRDADLRIGGLTPLDITQTAIAIEGLTVKVRVTNIVGEQLLRQLITTIAPLASRLAPEAAHG